MRANALVLMARAPEPGKTKTRLVPPFSSDEAAEISRCLLVDQIANLLSFRDADLFVAFTPDEAASRFERMLTSDVICFPQRGDDLGERMHHCFVELSARGYKNIVLVGSDLPALPHRFLMDAYRLLGEKEQRVVLGPSRDGGYYLIGMNRPLAEVFTGISWGSEHVFASTMERLADIGIPAHLLPQWLDIDTAEDVRHLMSLLDRSPEGCNWHMKQFLRSPAAKKAVKRS